MAKKNRSILTRFTTPSLIITAYIILLLAAFAVSYKLTISDDRRANLLKELTEASSLIEEHVFARTSRIAENISNNPALIEPLKHKLKTEPKDLVSELDTVRDASGAAIVYLMNSEGSVVASTRYDKDKKSLTGSNYRFRPYFIEAMKGGDCSYAAVGVTTGERGFYFSAPVKDPAGGVVIGVVAIKMPLDFTDYVLGSMAGDAAMISPEGVIFSSNRKGWLFHSITDLSAVDINNLKTNRRFPSPEIHPVASSNGFKGRTEYYDGRRHIVERYPLNMHGWCIMLSRDSSFKTSLTPFQAGMYILAFGVSVIVLLMVLLMRKNLSARAALEISEAKYQGVFDSVNDAIFIHDAATGKVLDVNRKAMDMYGFSKEDMKRNPADITSAADEGFTGEKAAQYIIKSAAEGPLIFEWKARDSKGNKFWVEVSLKKAVIGKQNVIIAVVRDINDRKLAEYQLRELVKELKRSNAELEDFAYVASHDMKEPLRMVSSYVSLLKKRYGGKLDRDADDFIAFASNGAAQMQRLIEDLLAFSRVGTKGGEFVATDTMAIMDRINANLKFKLDDKKAELAYTGLPEIKADPTQLEQVLVNLVGNAIKFSALDKRPKIEVKAQRDGKYWKFSVSDNGIGIDPQYFEKIFVIFQKLHPKDQYEGTGVGLAICRKIVERHGGKIWVESKPDEGSTFYFTIPINL